MPPTVPYNTTALMGWHDSAGPLPVSSPLLPYLWGRLHLSLASEVSTYASSLQFSWAHQGLPTQFQFLM